MKAKNATRAYQLTESQIRYAMENSTSNAEAAAWLNIDYATWRRYAMQYFDSESGLSLFELHKQVGKEIRRKYPKTRFRSKKIKHHFQAYEMTDILLNKHPKYAQSRFKYRLIHEGWKQERCDHCGYAEVRTLDYTVPLYLLQRDENPQNFALDNQEFCCHNCFYIRYGNRNGSVKKVRIDPETNEIVPAVPVRKALLAERIKKGPYFERKPHWGIKKLEESQEKSEE